MNRMSKVLIAVSFLIFGSILTLGQVQNKAIAEESKSEWECSGGEGVGFSRLLVCKGYELKCVISITRSGNGLSCVKDGGIFKW